MLLTPEMNMKFTDEDDPVAEPEPYCQGEKTGEGPKDTFVAVRHYLEKSSDL